MHHRAMLLFGRPDGTRVRDLPTLRVLMPHLMPGRNEAVVYFDQRLEVAETLRWAQAHDTKLFTIVLAAMVRALGQRPRMNRFIVGRRTYQRRGIQISFAVKKELSDGGKMTTVKVDFEAADTLDTVERRVKAAIGVGRGERATKSEKEMNLVTLLPRSGLRLLMWAQRALDYVNLLPRSMIEADPLYASMMIANLGSVGLDAAYHHLFEYGTCPLFGVLGLVKKAPVVGPDGELVVRDVVDVRYSYDERIADGFYAARTLELFKSYVESPAQLVEPPGEPAPA
jgi:hypothetical protein